MPDFIAVAVYDLDGNFRGYAPLNHAANKLKSTNLWTEEELPKLNEQLDRLNGHANLSAHWPQLDDPEVLALLEDPTWEPIDMEYADVVDDENSYYVWEEQLDPMGSGKMVKGDIDRQASVIVFKRVLVPMRPVEAQVRTRKAQELIATRRSTS